MARRNNNLTAIHQIDSNVNDESQDWLEKDAAQANDTNYIILNTNNVMHSELGFRRS